MQGFIYRNYRAIATFLIAGLLLLAFLVGFEEGKRGQSNAVVLSCADGVLSSLKVPVSTLAAGDIPGTTSGVATSQSGSFGAEQKVAGTSIAAPLGTYVGSKNGTKYYLPNCSSVKRIKPENYVWFKSAEDAKMQGYTEGSC